MVVEVRRTDGRLVLRVVLDVEPIHRVLVGVFPTVVRERPGRRRTRSNCRALLRPTVGHPEADTHNDEERGDRLHGFISALSSPNSAKYQTMKDNAPRAA